MGESVSGDLGDADGWWLSRTVNRTASDQVLSELRAGHALVLSGFTDDAPLIVIDPRGTLLTPAHRAGRRVVTLEPFARRPDQRGALNPLDRLDAASPSFASDCALLAQAVTGGTAGDPLAGEAEKLIAGLIAFIAQHASRPERHLGTLRQILAGRDLADDAFRMASSLKGPAAAHLRAFHAKGERLREEIRAVAECHALIFGGPPIGDAIRRSSFALGDDALTIHLIVPPARLQAYAGLLRVWLTTLIHERVTVAPLRAARTAHGARALPAGFVPGGFALSLA